MKIPVCIVSDWSITYHLFVYHHIFCLIISNKGYKHCYEIKFTNLKGKFTWKLSTEVDK